LNTLPGAARNLADCWSITLAPPITTTLSYVAPATLPDGAPAILKIGTPHFEADHEIAGLRFWDGDPTVRLLAADESLNAMLLERCVPGDTLRTLPEPEQDIIIASLLRRLWRMPPDPHPFRPLSMMLDRWAVEAQGPAAGLVREGLRLFAELPRTASRTVLLATDLHAGNVLRAQREPWIVIDPKPFLGDPAYDATQHLLNCASRLRAHPLDVIYRMADLVEVDRDRLHLWTFARAATGWPHSLDLARALAP
jgi:streptomycin 6-kinase